MKKSQITTIIIFGIVLLFIFGFMFYINYRINEIRGEKNIKKVLIALFEPKCKDLDGSDFNIKGVVTAGKLQLVDKCDTNEKDKVIETICDENTPKSIYYTCPNGCSEGACKSMP